MINDITPANELTSAQVAKLDRLAKEDPEARVITWAGSGPIIRRSGDGRLNRLAPNGRLTTFKKAS